MFGDMNDLDPDPSIGSGSHAGRWEMLWSISFDYCSKYVASLENLTFCSAFRLVSLAFSSYHDLAIYV